MTDSAKSDEPTPDEPTPDESGSERDDGSARATAVLAAKTADAKLATEIQVLNVSEVLGVCDYFVIATARNEPQVKAVVDEVEEQLREQLDERPLRSEGRDARRWVLLDYGDVIVHVFLATEREFYRLERLYGDVPEIPWAD
jgi:ribosome-associated protein